MADVAPPQTEPVKVQQVTVVVEKDKTVRLGLMILAILLILFSVTGIIFDSAGSQSGAIGYILTLIVSVVSISLGVLLLIGILMPSKKCLVAAYFACFILILFRFLAFLWKFIEVAVGGVKNEKGDPRYSSGSFVMDLLGLAILAVTPFAISYHCWVEFGHRMPVTPKELLTCAPCRGLKVKVEETDAPTPVPTITV